MIPALAAAGKSTKSAMGGSLMQEVLADLGRRIEEMRGYL